MDVSLFFFFFFFPFNNVQSIMEKTINAVYTVTTQVAIQLGNIILIQHKDIQM